MTLGSAGKARSAMRQVARASNTGATLKVAATSARPLGLSSCAASGLASASETQATTVGSPTASVCLAPNQDDCAAAGPAASASANAQQRARHGSIRAAAADIICEAPCARSDAETREVVGDLGVIKKRAAIVG